MKPFNYFFNRRLAYEASEFFHIFSKVLKIFESGALNVLVW